MVNKRRKKMNREDPEEMKITPADVGSLNLDTEADIDGGDDSEPADPFEGREPAKGLEALGRAIVDAAGVPSGSPANYEATRGKTDGEIITPEDVDRITADIAREFRLVGQ